MCVSVCVFLGLWSPVWAPNPPAPPPSPINCPPPIHLPAVHTSYKFQVSWQPAPPPCSGWLNWQLAPPPGPQWVGYPAVPRPGWLASRLPFSPCAVGSITPPLLSALTPVQPAEAGRWLQETEGVGQRGRGQNRSRLEKEEQEQEVRG